MHTFEVLVNWVNAPQSIIFQLADVGFTSAYLADLWTGADIGTVDASYTVSVDAHGALIYKLSNGTLVAPYQFTTYLANASRNVLAGGATTRPLSDNSIVVGDLGYAGTLTFVDVDGGENGGTKLLSLSYVNADYTFSNSNCSNCRRAEMSMNGGTPVVVEMPLSGQVRVCLGFKQSIESGLYRTGISCSTGI